MSALLRAASVRTLNAAVHEVAGRQEQADEDKRDAFVLIGQSLGLDRLAVLGCLETRALKREGKSYDEACADGDVVVERAELLERLVSGAEPRLSHEYDLRSPESR